MNSDFNWLTLKQLNGFQIILAFVIPSSIAFTGFRYVLPLTVNAGYPKVLMWGILATVMLFIFAIFGFVLLQKEAKELKISIFKRLLIKKISLKMWLLCLGIMVIGILLSVVVAPSVDFFRELPGLAIPDYMPFWLNPSIDPMNTEMDILSPNYPLQGNYTVLLIMALALILNILAEEIYFRAWLLPKMQRLGKWSWVLNGLLFALYHTFQLWLFPMLLVVSLATTLTVYLSKSILPAFVTHLVANFLMGILGILALVLG